jgi:hypothetical protein
VLDALPSDPIVDTKPIERLPTSIKQLDKRLATREKYEIPEEELEEKFVRGKSVLTQNDATVADGKTGTRKWTWWSSREQDLELGRSARIFPAIS